MTPSDGDLRRHCERRMGALDRERQSWFQHWRELSDNILPRRGQFLSFAGQSDRGRKLNGKMLDSTGTLAARTLASGLMSGVTSPARPWFRLTVGDPALAQAPGVRLWLDRVQEAMLRVFARSNLYNALATVYEELGVFGTGVLLILEDDEEIVRAWPLTVGEYWLASSDRQVVNTLYREFPLTVYQLVERFGRDAVSPLVREQYDAGTWDREVTVVHAIEPNEGRDLEHADNRNMPFRSVYYEKTGADDSLLSVSGFETFPAMCPRWHLVGNDVWGRSPGMDALPDVKGLQILHKRFGQALEKMVNPPMVAPPSMRNDIASTVSGAVTYVADPTGAGFRPAYARARGTASKSSHENQRSSRSTSASIGAVWRSARSKATAAVIVVTGIQTQLVVMTSVNMPTLIDCSSLAHKCNIDQSVPTSAHANAT